MEKSIDTLNEEIAAWHSVLKEKTANPLETELTVEVINESSVTAFNDAMADIAKAVAKHNYKSGNFEIETKKAKKQLELHYATTEVKDFDYHEKIKCILPSMPIT